RELQQRVARAALLEAPGALQIVELAVDVRAGELRQRNRFDAGRVVDAARDPKARSFDVGEGDHLREARVSLQNGRAMPGLAAVSTRRNSPFIRSSAASSSASKRSTIVGVVFDARASPNPSGYSTRNPSIRMTSSAPGNFALDASFAMSAWCSPSAHAIANSGVDTVSGSASSTAEGLASRER